MSKVKTMIVDDHQIVREGLKQLLGVYKEIDVISEATSGLDCLKRLESISPQIIFMDVRMPGISGIETTRLVHQKFPHIKIIMLTIYEDEQYVTEAIQAGASGYILKKIQKDELLKVIKAVMAGQAFLDPLLTAKVFGALKGKEPLSQRNEQMSLSQRELEILGLLTDGHTDRKIAEMLHLSKYTVRSHIKNLYRKLKVTSKSQAVAIALKCKIIRETD